MTIKKITNLAAALVSITNLTLAQNEATDSNKVEQLEPIIIQALRAQQQSPFAFKILNKKQLQQQNTGQDLPYVLQFQPSIVTSSDAGHGIGYTNMSIRGTDNSRINFTLNGVPINNPESQGTFLVNIPDMTSSTNSVQIQRGVGSSTNGGGSFGGSVSINNMVNSEKANGQVEGSMGSYHTYKLTIQAGTGRLKNGWAFDTRLSQIQSDGYVDRSNSNLRALQFLTSYQLSTKTKWSTNYMLGHQKTGQAWNGLNTEQLAENRRQNTLGLMPNGNFYSNQTDNYQQHFLQSFLDHQFSDHLKAQIGLFHVKGKGYYEEYRQDDAYDDYGLSPQIAGNDTVTNTDVIRQLWLNNDYYGGIYNIIYTQANWDIAFGGMVANYEGWHYGNILWSDKGGIAPNYRWYNMPAYKMEVNHYFKSQYKIQQQLIISAELQYRYIDYAMHGFRKNPNLLVNQKYHFINPKIGINYNFQQQENNTQSIFASYAIANKEPNRNDFEANENEIPKHETLHDIEIGYELWKRKWKLNANAYFMLYQNQLVLNGKINDVGAYTRVNVGQSHRIGIELDAQYKVLKNLTFAANATFSDNRIKNYTEYRDNWDTWVQEKIEYKNTQIAFSPNTIMAIGLNWQPLQIFNIHPQHKNLDIGLQWKYVGKQYLDNTANSARSLDDYQYTNLNIHYGLPLKQNTEIYFGLSVQNITNSLYSANGYTYSYSTNGEIYNSNYYFPQAGRYFLLKVGIKL